MSLFAFHFDFVFPLIISPARGFARHVRAQARRPTYPGAAARGAAARGGRSSSRRNKESSALVTAARPRSAPSVENRGTKPKGFRAKLKRALRRGPRPSKVEQARCTACDDEAKPSKVVNAACEHQYCHACVRQMASIAFKDRSMFPLRCCGRAFPPQQVVPALDPADRRVYFYRASEHATPPAERWYCPKANCRKFIRPRHIKAKVKWQKCPHCGTLICSTCRDLSHTGECSPDSGLGQILDVARRRHWQRCYRCNAMVERNGGCPHIICKVCGADFCYLCGGRWGVCSCNERPAVAVWQAEGGPDLAVVVAAVNRAERENRVAAGEQPVTAVEEVAESDSDDWETVDS